MALQVAAEWTASLASAAAAARATAERAEREAKERGARVDGARPPLKGAESEEDAPRGALDFFGACRCASLLKRGSITRAWKSRWMAIHDDELQCYNRAPALSDALHAVDVTRATLRLHEPSGLMSWALENGQLIQLFAATSKVMHAWADVCERGKIAVERGWHPSDLNRKERPTAYAG